MVMFANGHLKLDQMLIPRQVNIFRSVKVVVRAEKKEVHDGERLMRILLFS